MQCLNVKGDTESAFDRHIKRVDMCERDNIYVAISIFTIHIYIRTYYYCAHIYTIYRVM